MYCDNTEAIAIANESGITKGVRHFRAKVHYLREVIELCDIKLEKVHTDDNLADSFTKALAFPKHSKHTKNIGMLPASSLMYGTALSKKPSSPSRRTLVPLSPEIFILEFTLTRLVAGLLEVKLTIVSFGVDAAMDLKEKHQVFNATGEELSAVKQKLMLLD
nr:hypothetical protein [Tanacetum cinerariifolium]